MNSTSDVPTTEQVSVSFPKQRSGSSSTLHLAVRLDTGEVILIEKSLVELAKQLTQAEKDRSSSDFDLEKSLLEDSDAPNDSMGFGVIGEPIQVFMAKPQGKAPLRKVVCNVNVGEVSDYGVTVGQIYVAADGGRYGHLVTDVTTFADCSDVVTTPFTAEGWKQGGNRINVFKLTQVRYCLVEEAPDWMPPEKNS